MQPEPRHIHIGRGPGCVKPRENVAQINDVFGNDAPRIVLSIKAF